MKKGLREIRIKSAVSNFQHCDKKCKSTSGKLATAPH